MKKLLMGATFLALTSTFVGAQALQDRVKPPQEPPQETCLTSDVDIKESEEFKSSHLIFTGKYFQAWVKVYEDFVKDEIDDSIKKIIVYLIPEKDHDVLIFAYDDKDCRVGTSQMSPALYLQVFGAVSHISHE